ncbi:HipA family kinase [Ornithinicoccus halotolerans]|uniref:HipA family kinase n=1 Tax=Ornithinicoccus halotolerans TaxID=1748220 RepID=UPI001295091A|nr:HipA family kinase [Ornithinicoccus halotolerans]
MLQQVTATRYVLPLREGGSLPGVVEADDLGTYVLKFRGAGQGLKVLVAEVVVGELARGLGLPVPRLVEMALPKELARYEADEEVQDLLRASVGSNLGVDLLPGALGYDGSRPAEPELAAAVVWLDALTANPDRTWANPNLLVWHRRTWLIDHGAALYFHHGWPRRRPDPERFAAQPYRVDDHVLGELVDAPSVRAAHDRLAPRVPQLLPTVLAAVPDGWLEPGTDLPDAQAARAAYQEHLLARLHRPAGWLPGGTG